MRQVAVLDIGKTNVKVALVDLPARAEVAVRTMPNRVVANGPWPHFDVEGIWEFVLASLSDLQAAHGIDGIAVTTHGACAALLDAGGSLAAPVLDYEHPLERREAYDALRPSFALTGSPALPLGLNLGAQLHWQMTEDPGLRGRIAQVVMWPQYWGFRLTGRAACDVCSLGCHTDLWNPFAGELSPLVARLGLEGRIAPPRRPGDVLGTVLPELARRIGLSPDVPVLVGIHDSNASLVPHLTDRERPFAVVSTGTWVVAMAMGGQQVTLDPARDTLVNVNASGRPVPSARFMGGREFEMLREGRVATATPEDAARVLRDGVMLLPSVRPDSGPFQGRTMRWTTGPAGDGAQEVAASFYLALMSAECLSLIGAQGETVIEGPFAANPWFCGMLGAATGRAVVAAEGRTGTAIGAALLFAPGAARAEPGGAEPRPDKVMAAYAARWRTLL